MIRLISLLLLLPILFSCSTFSPAPQDPQIAQFTLFSEGLVNNALGDDPNRQVIVYLPPSYATNTAKRYPVVYLLHGFGISADLWTGEHIGIRQIMNRLIQQHTIQEMIVVMPDGNTSLGGTFYRNSSTVGQWEDFITQDLVTAIDQRYRTIDNKNSRGIAGHSMGGHGAMNIAMEHTDIYSAVYAMNPCCLGYGGGFESFEDQWYEILQMEDESDLNGASFKSKVLMAIATAFSADPDGLLFSAAYPYRLLNGKPVANPPIDKIWRDALPLHKAERLTQQLKTLRGIALESGKDDFPHIPKTTQLFSEKLTKLGIQNDYEMHDGGHFNKVKSRLETHVMPFFSRLLDAQSNEQHNDKIIK